MQLLTKIPQFPRGRFSGESGYFYSYYIYLRQYFGSGAGFKEFRFDAQETKGRDRLENGMSEKRPHYLWRLALIHMMRLIRKQK